MILKNSLYKVDPTSFDREILLPSSKSHANRALIIGAICGNGFQVHHLSTSSDVVALLNCLKKVGLSITHTENSVRFNNSFPACENETVDDVIELQTGDGGTTNRFLLALLSRGEKTYRFFPSEKMSERPIDDLLLPLKKLNVDIIFNSSDDSNIAWISLKGPALVNLLNLEKLDIDCSKSTQFASAMMLAFSDLPLTFNLKNVHASETYILMTRFVLKEAMIAHSYSVPVDFSGLSYPLALALIKGKVLVRNCKTIDPFQADSHFIKLMSDCGADIQWTKKGLVATCKNRLKPFSVDGSKFPDLVPTLAFVASQIQGKSIISNLSILRHKESDRLEQILRLLESFSVPFVFDEFSASIEIEGIMSSCAPVIFHPARDHRIVMTTYLFMRANQGGMLSEVDCVEKSFPNFFEIM